MFPLSYSFWTCCWFPGDMWRHDSRVTMMFRSALTTRPLCHGGHRFGQHCACRCHYNDVIMSVMASQITGVSIVYLNVSSGADQREHQSSASLVFVNGFVRSPVNSPHKGPVTREMFPFDDVIMICCRPSAPRGKITKLDRFSSNNVCHQWFKIRFFFWSGIHFPNTYFNLIMDK